MIFIPMYYTKKTLYKIHICHQKFIKLIFNSIFGLRPPKYIIEIHHNYDIAINTILQHIN
jgi:hypothetical protein